MQKRAILYARVSSDDRKNESRNLQGQIEMARDYAMSKGLLIVEELMEDDKGASGATFELPKLNQIREMAQRNEFDVLIVREIDRLSRSLAKQLIVEEDLKRAGVEIDYVLGDYPDTPEGHLMKNVRATIAEYEREKINERMIRGRRQKVKAGYVVPGGRAAYGYRSIQGKDDNYYFEVVEEEAKVIRMIFSWYVEGDEFSEPVSMRAVARRLTDLGIPPHSFLHNHIGSARKRPEHIWNHTSISVILSNKIYKGVWEYGRYTDEILNVSVPPIVDEAIWEAAQENKRRNKKLAKRNRKHNYLLTGHVRCGNCGVSATGQTYYPDGKQYQYYVCGASRRPKDYDHLCKMPSFRVEFVDQTVWTWVKDLLLTPEKLEYWYGKHIVENEEVKQPLHERLEIVESLLEENSIQYKRLIDLYISGDFPKEILTERKVRLQSTIEALEREHTIISEQVNAETISRQQLNDLQLGLHQISEGLLIAEDDYRLRRQLLRILGIEVEIRIEDKEKVLFIKSKLSSDSFDVVSTAIYGDCRNKNLD